MGPELPRRVRARHTVPVGTLIVLVAAVLVACGSGGGGPSVSDDSSSGPEGSTTRPYSELPAYAGVGFADALEADQDEYLAGLRQAELVGLTADDHAGRYVNVEGDVRATIAGSCSCPRVRLWLTGGSAAFGLGQRDQHTVASELVRLAEADGLDLEVVNLGVPGRTLWNEYQAVRARLDDPDVDAPDVIVSYGGYNDAVGALAGAVVGRDDPADPNELDADDLAAWGADGWRLPDDFDEDAVATLAVERYLAVADDFEALAREHGAPIRFVFHPDALADADQFAPVASIYRDLPSDISPVVGRQLERVASGLGDRVLDLRQLYDDAPSVFADWAHTNEDGASLAAAAIYDDLRPLLLDLGA